MEETVKEIASNPQHVVFAPACFAHGIMTSSKFQSIKVNLEKSLKTVMFLIINLFLRSNNLYIYLNLILQFFTDFYLSQ